MDVTTGDGTAVTAEDPARVGDGESAQTSALLVDAMAGWQHDLADQGGRNSLLWFKELPSGTLDLTTAHPGGVSMLMAGRATRLSDLVRETSAFGEARRRADVIHHKAAELLDERGLAAGYMAIGMATWHLPGATTIPRSPVLLRTCALRPTGPAHHDFDVDLGPQVELNPVLVHYLAVERNIHLDPQALADLAHVSRLFDPAPVFRELTRLCVGVPGFRITDRKIISTFSYAKLPSVLDLAAIAPGAGEHHVLRDLATSTMRLSGTGGEPDVPPLPAATALTTTDGRTAYDEPDLATELTVLDADSHQQRVLHLVASGHNVAVDAPPGTGTTQTIANLVAAQAAAGKSVLVVSAKRVALTSLVQRLGTVGLTDLVLDVGDGVHETTEIAHRLLRSLDSHTPPRPRDHTGLIEALVTHRQRLVDHRDDVHRRREPWGVSVHDAEREIARLTHSETATSARARLRGDKLLALSRDRLQSLSDDLRRAVEAGAYVVAEAEPAVKDPWYGARITTPDDVERAQTLVGELANGELESIRQRLDAVLARAGLPPARTASDWVELFDLLRRIDATLGALTPAVHLDSLGPFLAATGDATYRRTESTEQGYWQRRNLRKEAVARFVRPDARVPELHAALVEADAQCAAWALLSPSTPTVPEGLAGALDDLERLCDDLAWLGSRLAGRSGGVDLVAMELADLDGLLKTLAARADRLRVLPEVLPILDRLREAGLGQVVEEVAGRGLSADHACAELEFVWWSSILTHVMAHDQAYGDHHGTRLRSVVAEYQRLDRTLLSAAPGAVRAAVDARLRTALADHPEQATLVRAQAHPTRRHRTVRDLAAEAPEVLRAAAPCWISSPLVVASAVPVGAWFDTVVIDGASRLSPAEAVSALSRARQVVLFGDEELLGPTSFVTGAGEAEAVETPIDGGSLYAHLAGSFERVGLSIDHRGDDERLLEFANHTSYGDRLVTSPGSGLNVPVTTELVEISVPADGDSVELSGPEDTLAALVHRVVRAILEHARRRPTSSFGVVTVGVRHAEAIREALLRALDNETDPGVVDVFSPDRTEPFFVKDVAHAQGDTRDVVYLSVGVLPRVGRSVELGPLVDDSSVAALAVATTRARRRLTVITPVAADDLDPARLGGAGPQRLRELLTWAEGGQWRAEPSPSPGPSPLMSELATRLRREGYVVHEAFGRSAHPIDLAVEDPYIPGRLVVAVESDGLTYGAIASTRDRERLRPEHLHRLGWEYVRVWGTDVFRDPVRDVSRVIEAVRVADVKGAWGKPRRG